MEAWSLEQPWCGQLPQAKQSLPAHRHRAGGAGDVQAGEHVLEDGQVEGQTFDGR